MTCGIYKITNLVNGKIYIGKSVNIENRIQAHKSAAKTGKSKIYRAFKKYGFNSFKIEIVEVLLRENSVLTEREIFWIRFYNSKEAGYNETLGGDGSLGLVQSPEHRKKTAQAAKRMWSDESFKKKMSEKHKGQNNGMFGKTHSEEAMIVIKQKASEWSRKNKEYIRQKSVEQFSDPKNREKVSVNKKEFFSNAENRENIRQKRINWASRASDKDRLKGKFSPYAKKVICLDDGTIFECARDALRSGFGNVSQSARTGCKANGRRWMYYDDWVKTQKQAA